MIFPIFPARKPKIVLALAFIGVVAGISCFFLPEYWVFRPIPAGVRDGLEPAIERYLAQNGVERDSSRALIEPSFDEEIVSAVKQRFGAAARLYLDTAGAQEILYRVRIDRMRGGEFGINFSSGNRSRPKSGVQPSSVDKDFIVIFWLNDAGEVVGEKRNIADSLSRLLSAGALAQASLPDSVSPAEFLALERFSRFIPKNFTASALSDWRREVGTTDKQKRDKFAWARAVSRDELLTKEVTLSVEKISSEPEEIWAVEWSYKVSPDSAVVASLQEKEAASDKGVLSALKIAFGIAVAVGIFTLATLFILRLRRKAINIWILPLALVTGVSMGSITLATAVGLPWYGVLIIFISFAVTFGLFVIAIPLATTVSIAREVFSEKFHTIQRFASKPWTSFHVGNMTLVGASLGAVYALSSLLLPLIGEKLGIASLAAVHLQANNYSLAFVARSAWAALLQIPGNTAPMLFTLFLLPALSAYRFAPKRLAPALSFLLMLIVFILFEVSQEGNADSLFVRSLIQAALGALVIHYADVLALAAFVVVSSILISMGLIPWQGFAPFLTGATLGGIFLFGFVVYFRNKPEEVTESEYKPDFVTQMEEEKRLSEEIRAAKSVQEKLLPRSLPRQNSVTLSAACIPAYEVGGDYYDFFHLDDKRLGVLIGDVSGKGISAAFYITLAKGVIVSQVREKGSPAEILHRVNELLYGVMERGKFVSMIYGIFDADTREFTFANAGHNPLIARRASGEIVSVPGKGMAIGLDKGERFARAVANSSLTLEKDDCVLLYTDGVTEAMNVKRDEYGEERLLAVVAAAPLQAADIVSATLADVRSFVGKANQHDDITLVAMQVL